MKQKLMMICLFAAFSFNLNAQIDVTIDPLGLLFGSITAGVDYGFSEDLSAEARFGFASRDITLGGVEYSGNGFEVKAFGKYYFSPADGCDKWHIGPFIDYNLINLASDNEPDVAWTRLGVGLYSGYKWVSGRGVVFDIGLGFGRNFINEFDSDDGQEVDLTDIPFLFDFNVTGKLGVGYRFGGGGKK